MSIPICWTIWKPLRHNHNGRLNATIGGQGVRVPMTTKEQMLEKSQDMSPVQGTVDVDIPIKVLWASFTHANLWPRWNKCFFWTHNRDLVLGQRLIWAFQPIKAWYLYKMWAIANIVEVEDEKKVTWEVTAFPGMYARHTYHMEDLGNGRTRFGSWEKATGWGFRIIKKFWITHFTFVKDKSLEGAVALNEQYQRTGALTERDMPEKSYLPFWTSLIMGLLLFGAVIGGGWLYFTYVYLTSTALAPGVHAVFGGGGNSLIVHDGDEALVVDTKFPPGSSQLQKWIASHVLAPVKTVVNTHYHYDHTEGNSLYPEARKVAYKTVPDLMHAFDNDWWVSHGSGLPDTFVTEETLTLKVGSIDVILTHPLAAHTSGDVWVFLPKQNIVATGDLVFNKYYPFLDQPEGGTSISGMIQIVRSLAAAHPMATFLPGHGPLATAMDLRQYADYLEYLYNAVEQAHRLGWSVEEAESRIDLSHWHLSVLPSFHHKTLIWSTSTNNIRWAYGLWQATSQDKGSHTSP